jgi:hypothetical protein
MRCFSFLRYFSLVLLPHLFFLVGNVFRLWLGREALNARPNIAQLPQLPILAKGRAALDIPNASASQTATIPARGKSVVQMEVSHLPFFPISGIHQLSSCIAFCAVGHYCTNVGCCSDINSLAECGAAVSLSTIPPSTSPTSSSLTKSTSSIVEKTGSTTGTTASTSRTTESSRSTTRTTSSIAGTSSSLTSTTHTQLISQSSSSPLSTTTTPNSILSSTVSATTSTPSQKTANVARKLKGGVFSFSLYGLSFLFLFL